MAKVFLSYSHQDEKWKERVSKHLLVLGEPEVWDDRQINLGTDWLPAIESAIKSADIAILLISVDFLASNFIRTQEVPRLLERRQSEGLVVIPVIVHPCAWLAVDWLARIQCHPKDGKALSRGKKAQVEQDLADLAMKLREKLAAPPSPVLRAGISLKMEAARAIYFRFLDKYFSRLTLAGLAADDESILLRQIYVPLVLTPERVSDYAGENQLHQNGRGLVDWLNQVSAEYPTPPVLLISGEAGSGKTTLLSAITDSLASSARDSLNRQFEGYVPFPIKLR